MNARVPPNLRRSKPTVGSKNLLDTNVWILVTFVNNTILVLLDTYFRYALHGWLVVGIKEVQLKRYEDINALVLEP